MGRAPAMRGLSPNGPLKNMFSAAANDGSFLANRSTSLSNGGVGVGEWRPGSPIVIVPVIRSKAPRAVRAFFNVRVAGCPPRDRAYVPIARAGREPALRRQVIENALREAEAWWRRYEGYKELAAIGAAIGAAIRRLRVKRAA